MKTLYTDCFVLGKNPSDKGGGYLICNETCIEIERKTVLKNGFTNNEGELLGVLRASELIDSGGTIYTDSRNTIAWVRSGKSKARPDLNDIMKQTKDNIRIKNIILEWKPREENLAGILVEDINIK